LVILTKVVIFCPTWLDIWFEYVTLVKFTNKKKYTCQLDPKLLIKMYIYMMITIYYLHRNHNLKNCSLNDGWFWSFEFHFSGMYIINVLTTWPLDKLEGVDKSIVKIIEFIKTTSNSQQMIYQKNILIFCTHEEVGNHYEQFSFQ